MSTFGFVICSNIANSGRSFIILKNVAIWKFSKTADSANVVDVFDFSLICQPLFTASGKLIYYYS